MVKSEFVQKFKARTKKLAIEIIWLYDRIKKTDSSIVAGRQLIRSITSVAANYRAACIARSQAEFFSKMSIVVEEADESLFWLEVIDESGMSKDTKLPTLMKECEEIVKVVSKARKNAGKNK
ncbi:MAG: four helix bundle protein [Reichenbachiella sp.]|uniref:four helix bundle protein n=1 Tax=Reichenbachiella sp. TaxID=2184521 RepID=UPI00329725D6